MTSIYPFVCRLQKTLYSLKNAPRLWQKHLKNFLSDIGLVPLASNKCIYIHERSRILILTYVDDFFILGRNIDQINSII